MKIPWSKPGNLLLLHIIVLIFGFTGILGRLIETAAGPLVWWRMLIASAGIAAYSYAFGKIKKSLRVNFVPYALTGTVIAAHWITFFAAIKLSNVSVTLACLSASTLFTALLEPLFFKRRVNPWELFFGLLVIAGLSLIFTVETSYRLGIGVALVSAFLAALFTTINGRLIQRDNPYRISLVEMLAGTAAITVWLALRGDLDAELLAMPPMDWLWIALLGLVATAFAFVGSVKVMEELTPFTVALTVNLEPVYGIVLAWFIFGESERMEMGFYIGTALILLALYLNALLRKKKMPSWARLRFK